MKSKNLRKTDSEVKVLLKMGRKDNTPSEKTVSDRVASLKYIYDMLLELRLIAKAAKEEPLVYYLEMSAMEASDGCDALMMKRDGEADK